MSASLERFARLLWRLVLEVLRVPLNVLAQLVPMDRRLVLFGAWEGTRYLDNPKYLFLAALERRVEDDLRPIWFTRDRQLRDQLRERGLPVVCAGTVQGVLAQLRAAAVVYTHRAAADFDAALLHWRTLRVQTWHGIPLKRIGFDDERHASARSINRLLRYVLPHRHERCDLVLASSDEDRRHYASAFDTPLERIAVAGYARNDRLVRSFREPRGEPDRVRRAIYMPTFRGKPGSAFELFAQTGCDFAELDRALDAMNVRLDVKLHPVQRFRPEDLRAIDACRCITALEDVEDIYAELHRYDVLVTDYSGALLDFLLSRRPIVVAALGLEQYLRDDRSLYYALEEICPEDPCSSWAEVVAALAEAARRDVVDTPRYDAVRSRFHAHDDAGSADRGLDALLERMAA